MKELSNLQDCISYRFKDIDLLQQALTHRSAPAPHNERLEYLGDAILNFVIAYELYKRFPFEKEGKMSHMRAVLVRESTLAEIARDFQLGNYLRLGQGEKKCKGYKRESLLANAVEALIGAIFLDSNINKAQECILKWYSKKLDDLDPHVLPKDPKTRLQEYLQSKRMPLPIYKIETVKGTEHSKRFTVGCYVNNIEPSFGTGTSRRKAEQSAAELMLKELLSS